MLCLCMNTFCLYRVNTLNAHIENVFFFFLQQSELNQYYNIHLIIHLYILFTILRRISNNTHI